MFKNLLLNVLFVAAYSLSIQAQTKNIVINETTYKKLTAPGLNHVKLAKNADIRKGIIRVKDAPHERLMFEKLMTQNPQTGELENCNFYLIIWINYDQGQKHKILNGNNPDLIMLGGVRGHWQLMLPMIRSYLRQV